MNYCIKCSSETSNPKFCSRSCAASFNNTVPGRPKPGPKPKKRCKTCGNPITYNLTYCTLCKPAQRELVITAANSNSSNNPYVRNQARKLYIKSGRPLSCCLCGYDKHVDICHIRDVREHPVGTQYSLINRQDNILAMCKNHHWEFDHDML